MLFNCKYQLNPIFIYQKTFLKHFYYDNVISPNYWFCIWIYPFIDCTDECSLFIHLQVLLFCSNVFMLHIAFILLLVFLLIKLWTGYASAYWSVWTIYWKSLNHLLLFIIYQQLSILYQFVILTLQFIEHLNSNKALNFLSYQDI